MKKKSILTSSDWLIALAMAYAAVIASKELPIMLFGHDSHSVPIGKWVSLEKDEVGLKVTGQLNLNNAKAKEVFDAIQDENKAALTQGNSNAITALSKMLHK